MDYWNFSQILEWIKDLRLSEASMAIFAKSNIDGKTLLKLSFGDLRELGIKSVGCRIKILKAVFEEKIARNMDIDDAVDYVPETFALQRELAQSSKSGLPSSPISVSSSRVASKPSLADDSALKEREDLIETLIRDLGSLGAKSSLIQVRKQHLLQLAANRQSQSPTLQTADSSDSKWSAPPTVIKVFRTSSTAGTSNSEVLYKTFLVKPGRDKVASLIPIISQKFKLADDPSQLVLCINDTKETQLAPDADLLRLLARFKSVSNYPSFLIKTLSSAQGSAKKRRDKTTENSETLPQSKATTPVVPSLPIKGTDDEHSAPATAKSTGVHHATDKLSSEEPVLNGRAVAVYDYKAKLDDELNVAIGERFRIMRVDTGWCVVQREQPNSSGRSGEQGWVPAVVLSNVKEQAAEEPIQDPVPGLILKDYQAAKSNELSVSKGDAVLVHRKYHNWLLLEGTDRKGWVPSWAVQMSPVHNAVDSSEKAAPVLQKPLSGYSHHRPRDSTLASSGARSGLPSASHKKTASQSNSIGFKTPVADSAEHEKELAGSASKAVWSNKSHRRSQSSSVALQAKPILTLDLPEPTGLESLKFFSSDSAVYRGVKDGQSSSNVAELASSTSESVSGSPLGVSLRKTLSESSVRSGNKDPKISVVVGKRVDSMSGSPVPEFASPKPSSGVASAAAMSSGAKSKLDFLMESVNQLLDGPSGGALEPTLSALDVKKVSMAKSANESLTSGSSSGSQGISSSGFLSGDSFMFEGDSQKHALSVGTAIDLLTEVSANAKDAELKLLIEAVLDKMHGISRQSAIPVKLEPLVKKLAFLSGINMDS